MSKSLTLFSLSVCISFFSYSQEEYINKFEKRILPVSNEFLYYSIFSPEKIKEGKRYPLVLALHGQENQWATPDQFMERAASILWGWVTPQVQSRHPCYVLAPHFSDPASTPPAIDGWTRPNAQVGISILIDSLIQKGYVDPNRVYVTGHSLGGGATWAYPINLEDRFAAIVPTSYVNVYDETKTEEAKKIYSSLPIWSVYHREDGVKDDDRAFLESIDANFIATDYYGSREVLLSNEQINNLIDAHTTHFYTEFGYPCGGEGELNCHFAMDSVIVDALVHKWLFQQYKQDPEAIAVELREDDENLSISWEIKNNRDEVAIWVKPENTGKWQLIHTTSAAAKNHQVKLSSLPQTKTLLVRTLIKNGDGFVYGQDEKSIVISTNTPLGSTLLSFDLYPNPVSNLLQLKGDINQMNSLQIYSSSGKKVLDHRAITKKNRKELAIDVSSLDKGTYVLIVDTIPHKFYKR